LLQPLHSLRVGLREAAGAAIRPSLAGSKCPGGGVKSQWLNDRLIVTAHCPPPLSLNPHIYSVNDATIWWLQILA